MSGEKTSSPCNKFQANVFNKSKCQNCFKSRELHLLRDRDQEQAKPVYGGWLCLAPEGTDFDNPMQRSRKWQRRFFILYERGSLSFALDELPSTLPQGTVNLNLCTDIGDAEPRTGQRNALCIATSQQEIFIRGDNKEIINGWSEQLAAYLRTNKQVQKKKRKVEPVATAQVATLVIQIYTEQLHPLVFGENISWKIDRDFIHPKLGNSGVAAARFTQHTFKMITLSNSSFSAHTSDSFCFNNIDVLILFFPILQPDLLNFKKGWMMKLDESDQWKKYWFVLSTDRLRFYKDSMTEEASDLEGELDLTRCYNVSEFLVQRNYGFQIHTPKSVYTLSAMTAGIRKNWIQSLMKNVHPAHAPDVTSLSRGPLELLPRPDRDPHPKPRSVTEKRREGRYRTFDWAEFRPQSGPAPPPPPEAAGPRAGPPCPLELGDLDRRRRREERRRRYEDTLGFSLSWRETGAETEDGSGGALSPRSQRRVEEEIEEMWRQVETTVFRPDGTVPLFTHPWFGVIHSAATEALYCCRLSRLRSECEKELEETKEKLLDCVQLSEENKELKARLSNLEERRASARGEKRSATCQRGFVSVDESHLKVVEELQRRHRQEVERLLVERDQLLEEESAATATAIEAITNAHRLELQREEQRRRCHEEMESFQRELEVLSQQFCLKCLENGHLLQALDAERKALGQCQQENQELRTRNQELSVHLAAEITRLCSLAKQSELPLGRQMDVYEMEITLRVKESEVQCLKQEITSLKDELQAAQRDKRNATKMYKDVYTELSIVRAKTSRDVDELRENLRLAHREVLVVHLTSHGFDLVEIKMYTLSLTRFYLLAFLF
uniref:PH domain-containing protein n=1 Tax=Scophthalmus maximus TaxID=52904 RepID=A0A8D3BW48_SCOMX